MWVPTFKKLINKINFTGRIISSGQDDEPLTDEECSTSSNEKEHESKDDVEQEKENKEGESESEEEVTHNSEVQVSKQTAPGPQCSNLHLVSKI